MPNHPLPDAPWGLLLAWYFVLIGLSSGITLITCGQRAWRREARQPATDLVGAAIALVLLGIAGLLLIVDLGRPDRFFLMLTNFTNLGSPISVGAKLIALKGFLLVTDLYLGARARAADGSIRRPGNRMTSLVVGAVTWSLGIVSFALAIYPAIVLSRTWLAPLAATSGAALVFLLTACVMGAAVHLVLAREDAAALRVGTLALLAGYAVTLAMQALSVTGDEGLRTSVVAGSGALALWGSTAVVLGIAAPAAALTVSRSRSVHLAAAALILFGSAACRYLFFVLGR